MATEYLRRTAITRLSVSPVQADLLEDTIDEWRRGATIAAVIGWEQEETRQRKLQSLAYDEVRDRTTLGSQHTILACFQAAQALSTVAEQKQRGRAYSKPTFTAPTVKYDSNSMTLFDDETVSLATTGDRIRCDLCLPEDNSGYQHQYLNDEWTVTESTLTAREGSFFLHIGFRKPAPEASTAENRTVLGVDLGIENLAVTSTARFESGAELDHERRAFERVRAGLQRTGTQSARRTLVRRRNKERRRARDYLHRVANAIIVEAETHDCTHIVFENLEYIGEDYEGSWTFHRWAHRKLTHFVRYKAKERGIAVERVDPANTSRTCCECGHTSETNRVSRSDFECGQCGATAHADYNAAKNIGMRLVRRGQQDSRRTGNSRLALKSGTVTPNRGFTPYPSHGVEAENTDKSSAP